MEQPPAQPSPLGPGCYSLAPGMIANVVTFLEMTRRPPPRAVPSGAGQAKLMALGGDVERYRAIFRRIGERWMWVSRLELPVDALRALIADPQVAAHAVVRDGRDCGLLELDFRMPGEAEIVFFGLTEDVLGAGLGRWLMEQALDLAWSWPVNRVWLHTCTLDHPGALAFYRRSGFKVTRLEVEVTADPRLSGIYPLHAFPDLPPVG